MQGEPLSMRALAERLADTLENVARGLVALDVDVLLDAERTLAELVGAYDPSVPVSPSDRVAIDAAVRRGKAALLRCRRLGASFTAIARVRVPACRGGDTYNRAGAIGDRAGASSRVEARV
jgi:hypothetical protein